MPSDDGIIPHQFYSPKAVAELENVSLATVYVRLARGEYRAFRDGAKTQIAGSEILARRHDKLTPATFKTPKLQGPRFHTLP
jgi:hypothetical protein